MTGRTQPDHMICRACQAIERASEGYPCDTCGTFICLACSIHGVTRCSECVASLPQGARPSPGPPPR